MIIYLSISSRPDLDFIANVQHPSTLNILASFEYKNSMKRWLIYRPKTPTAHIT